MDTNLLSLCTEGTRLYAGRVAIKHLGRELTFGELDESRKAFAAHLARQGIKKGDYLVLVLENSLDYVVAFFGSLTLGAVVVPLNPDSTTEAVSRVAAACKPRLIISRASTAHRLGLESIGTELLLLLPRFDDNRQQFYRGVPDTSIAGPAFLDPAMILFTSGTTGRPKGVVLSHKNLLANTRSIVEYLRLTSDDSIVNVLPFFYSFGNSILLTHLACGGRIVIENGFMFPSKVVEVMQKERPTGFSGVPATYYVLLSKSNFASYSWEFMRYITQAGGGMRTATMQRLMTIMPKTQICIMYGQTEASARLTYLPPEMLLEKIGSIGKAIPGVEIRVVDEQVKDVHGDEVGEIIARGDNIMIGYLNDPEATAQTVRDGWLYTGDMARMDEDGFIFVSSRKSDFIKTASYRVSPGEIEEIIAEVGGIEDVAAIGVEDELLGEAIMACVSCPPQHFSAEAIRKHCLARLPFYKVPKYVVHEPELPRTASGKKKYDVLRIKYRKALASSAN